MPPATFDDLRWRLQLIAEEEVGKRIRAAQAAEDAVAAKNRATVNEPE